MHPDHHLCMIHMRMEQIFAPLTVIPWWQRDYAFGLKGEALRPMANCEYPPDTWQAKYIFETLSDIMYKWKEYGTNRHAHVFLRDGYVQYDVCDEYFTGVQSEMLRIHAKADKYEKYRIQGEILFETNKWLNRKIIFDNGYTTTIHWVSQLVDLILAT